MLTKKVKIAAMATRVFEKVSRRFIYFFLILKYKTIQIMIIRKLRIAPIETLQKI